MVRSWATLPICVALIAAMSACAGDDPAYVNTEATCASDDECPLGERCDDSTCVAGEGDAGTQDTGAAADVSGQDTADPMDTGEQPGVGAPCDDAEDCPSGYCIEAAGSARRICTDFCDPSDDTCPDGFTCAAVGNSGADVTFLCFPETELLCQPCEADSDCGGLSDLCLDLEDGSFCGRDCQLQACPDGYTCAEVANDDGDLLAQCRPTAGFCSACLDPDGDEFGQGDGCLGRDCNEDDPDVNEGAFELCNNADDDCDDLIDEGFDFQTDPARCGSCTNTCAFEGAEPLCVDGRCERGDCLENRYDIDGRADNGCEYFCEPSEDGVEVCNGEDDNCDGRVDEGDPGGGGACGTEQDGICAAGTEVCSGGEVRCVRDEDPRSEVCNGRDDDCDGEVDNGNPGGGAACNTGLDGICNDGTLTCVEGDVTCVQLREATDEACNGRDDNCDGRVDEGNPGGGGECDTGQDGICAAGTLMCQNNDLFCVRNDSPRAETCNGRDDNCDGVVDEGNPGGGGACNTGLSGACAAGELACVEGDVTCVQLREAAAETCNGEDDDCDGVADNGNPGGGGACDTGEDGICAAGTEVCLGGDIVCEQSAQPRAETCNGEDDDCDGVADNGNPGGGAACDTGVDGICAAGTEMCVDGDIVCAQNEEPRGEACNGRDDDCDGEVDNGNPGGGAACNTGEEGICASGTLTCQGGGLACVQDQAPRAETCNGRDDNCDGAVDEGNPGGGAVCDTGQEGICAIGTERCVGGEIACVPNEQPRAESCNGEDDNCDGRVDEDNPGGGAACNTGEDGICADGTLTCAAGRITCAQIREPTAETCNGRDDNCDGAVDEGNPNGGGACNTGLPGICSAGTEVCAGGNLICSQDEASRSEECNGEDDDCDGVVDDGNPGGGASCLTGESGVCATGTLSCSGGGLVCNRNQDPSGEVCNGRDDSCNGTVDNDCPSNVGTTGSVRNAGSQGGGGGDAFTLTCPSGYALIGADVKSGSEVDRIRGVCQDVRMSSNTAVTPYTYAVTSGGNISTTSWAADSDGGTLFNFRCQSGEFVYQIYVESGSRVDRLRLDCARYPLVGSPTNLPWGFSRSYARSGTYGGNGGDNTRTITCSGNEAAVGFYGRAGDRIDQIGLRCQDLSISLR